MSDEEKLTQTLPATVVLLDTKLFSMAELQEWSIYVTLGVN